MEKPPIACTLNLTEFADRSELWRTLIENWGIKRKRTQAGVHLIPHSPDERVKLLHVRGDFAILSK